MFHSAQFLTEEQQAKDRRDSLERVLVSGVGMVIDDNRTRLISVLFALTGRFWIRNRRLQAHAMPSVKRHSAGETERAAAEQRAVRGSAESG